MVANYRCNEIKEESFRLIAEDIHKLEAECAAGVVDQFGVQCSAILRKATDNYNDIARQYAKDVRDKILQELVDQSTQ